MLNRSKLWSSTWLRISFKEILSPISDSAALVQILPILFVIYLVYLAKGTNAAEAEVVNIWAAQQTLLAIVPVFVVICMMRSIFLTNRKIEQLGQWHGNTFIYNSPQQIFTITVTSEDNSKTHLFEVNGVPINSLVTIGFAIDRRDELVKAQLSETGQPNIDWRGASPKIRLGFRLPKNRKLALLTLSDPAADPTTIRVYAYKWEVLPSLKR